MRRARAFTLLELVIVVAIIAVVAALAAPRLAKGRDRAAIASTAGSFRAFLAALEAYRVDYHALPGDVWFRNEPLGMQEYIASDLWAKPVPIGGDWDWNGVGWSGTKAPGMSAHVIQATAPKLWSEFDRAIDNGSPHTGVYRIIKNGTRLHLQVTIE